MKVGAYFFIVGIVICSILSTNTAFADNKTGLYQVQCMGSHYYAYVPKDCAKTENIPLVVALHGNSSTAERFIKWWQEEADKYKFAVIAVQCEGKYWSYKSEPVIIDSMSNFQNHCKFNKKRILLTGFGCGGEMALALNFKMKRCQGVGICGGGEIDDDFDRKDLSKSKDLPVYIYSATTDYNLEDVKKGVKRLKDAGYKKVTFETVVDEDAEEDTICYLDDASEKIWLWFDKIGVVHHIDELKPKAKKAYEDKDLVESYFYYFSIKLLCKAIDDGEYKDNKTKVDEIVKDTKEKLKKLEEIWEKKEPDEFKTLGKCLKYMEKQKSYEAAKKLMKVIEEYPETKTEELAKLLLDKALSEDVEAADKLAGSKIESEFKDAKKILMKEDRTEEEKDEAIKVLKKIQEEHPYTSFAKEAIELIRKYEFS